MTSFLVLIYGDEQRWAAMSADEGAEIERGHKEFQAAAGDAIVSSGQLESMTQATTVRAGESGETSVTDGPFLESKEVVGGFYLVKADSRDDVVGWASMLTETRHDHSGVEIVPLVQRG